MTEGQTFPSAEIRTQLHQLINSNHLAFWTCRLRWPMKVSGPVHDRAIERAEWETLSRHNKRIAITTQEIEWCPPQHNSRSTMGNRIITLMMRCGWQYTRLTWNLIFTTPRLSGGGPPPPPPPPRPLGPYSPSPSRSGVRFKFPHNENKQAVLGARRKQHNIDAVRSALLAISSQPRESLLSCRNENAKSLQTQKSNGSINCH